jgi:hypothetical protein
VYEQIASNAVSCSWGTVPISLLLLYFSFDEHIDEILRVPPLWGRVEQVTKTGISVLTTQYSINLTNPI